MSIKMLCDSAACLIDPKLASLGYEAVGELNAQLPSVLDWQEEFHELASLWNIWDQVDSAREIIAQKDLIQSSDVIGLLPQDDTE